MVSIVSGFVGGLVATIAMTAVMMAVGDDSPPPTAALWAKYVGSDGPETYLVQGIALHLGYGVAAGGVFAAALPALGLSATTITMGLGWGVVYGVLLFVLGATFWMRVVLAIEPKMGTVARFALFHLVYGVVLGAWVGLAVLA